ncbi:MAG: alpha/beta hydrolase [Myxococcota bacterium]
MARLPPELSTLGREVAAVAKQASLWSRDLTRPIVPRDVQPGDHIALVLHGLFASAGVMRPLRHALDRCPQVKTASMTYPPGPGIETLADRVHRLVETLPEDARLHLIGHSTGGIVARHYAHRVMPSGRVVQTVSLAAPFAGVAAARVAGRLSPLARDLAPDSAVLRALRLESATSDLPHLSILAEKDGVIGAPTSHALVGGEVRVIPGCGHNGVLYHPDALAAVAARIGARLAAP